MRSAVPSSRAAGTVLVVFGLIATLASLLVPVYFFDGNRSAAVARSGWQDDGEGTWKTEYGPLTSLDREFLRTVRATGLWELPAGRSARERSDRRSVRIVGDHLVDGDTELDRRVIEAGRTLKVALPNKPTGTQQGYLDELKQAKGEQFDKVLVGHLRKHNGGVINLVALVRDQTQNSMVRSLATRVNSIVLDHLAVLEDTGLIDYDQIINKE
ncbi:uncharacterized protein DUF4142 [Streptomyces sp. Amel2xB2]|uniref:DUF4142 domain-containing protein n=1 Tax=Streptomyces sp. Amel2xB2 TaxID=1305829 RepID=UPI000DBA6CA9|nr:DUF4142 domain-containing protein [Streptomyces sp. Amel2xB2]RAJ68829.1 uncharacterized protein DUF4142 [Streptomyces sp. Amel2xB2]